MQEMTLNGLNGERCISRNPWKCGTPRNSANCPLSGRQMKMKCPTIKSVAVSGIHTLLVGFSNSDQRMYDVSPLLNREMFSVLKNPAFFRNVRVDAGGYAPVWNEDTDISEYEIWIHGTPVPEKQKAS